ncbi:helix-turn-helix domain-containing protein [Paenibacillus xerothermodurans]|uniref:helix-turn-helix domain-containing protein n=1 Tax=Paenibacillus xerothermodurans TaxID=1977292 RepID=UPI0014039F9E|nr:helix-turn-helix domain-containing protein [Paenibacillus xerothermodurans]
MKLVIADDESLVRASLVSMIHDMEASWNIVCEAADGEELLEAIAQYKPHIAIVDIHMPKLGGLDAIPLGKEISPLTEWVILSGFSDFGYAQQAMKLGVSEYLLKPVDPAELEKTLAHIYKDNKDYIVLLNQQFENNLFALCHGLTALSHEERGSLLHQGVFIGWMLCLDASGPTNRAAQLQQRLCEEIRQSVETHLTHGMNVALLALPDGEVAAVGAWDRSAGEPARRRVHDFFRGIEQIIVGYRTGDMTVTILRTGERRGFAEVNRRLHELQKLGELRAIAGIGRSLDYEDLIKEADKPNYPDAARLLCALGNCSENRMYLDYHHAVNELEALVQKQDLLAADKTRQAIRSFIRYSIGLYLPESVTAVRMIAQLRQYGEHVLRGIHTKEPTSPDVVGELIRYIEKHYMDDIGLGQIATQLNVSPNYLGSMFHKRTGVPFVKYLTRIRMLKAQELLMHTHLQVKQVAEQVGYHSTRHFTKLFTQTFGKYPSDYRKQKGQLQDGIPDT